MKKIHILLQSRNKKEKYKPESLKHKIKVSSWCKLLVVLICVYTDWWLNWKLRGIIETWTLYLKQCTRKIPIFECLKLQSQVKKLLPFTFVKTFTCKIFFLLNTFWFSLKDILYLKQDDFFLVHFRFASIWLHLCSFLRWCWVVQTAYVSVKVFVYVCVHVFFFFVSQRKSIFME